MNPDIEKIATPLKQYMKENLQDWVGEKESDLEEHLTNVFFALQRMAEELGDRGETELGKLVLSGAKSLDQVIQKMNDSDAESFLETIEQQSKENAAGTFLASLLAGFVGTRVVKQSVSHAGEQANLAGEGHREFNKEINDGGIGKASHGS